jgi:hypothetical protein
MPLGELATGSPNNELCSPGNIYQLDTAQLFAVLCGTPNERRSLERTSQLLGIPDVKYLHNAGNDAHVNLPPTFSLIKLTHASLQWNV